MRGFWGGKHHFYDLKLLLYKCKWHRLERFSRFPARGAVSSLMDMLTLVGETGMHNFCREGEWTLNCKIHSFKTFVTFIEFWLVGLVTSCVHIFPPMIYFTEGYSSMRMNINLSSLVLSPRIPRDLLNGHFGSTFSSNFVNLFLYAKLFYN